jgi:PAS domain S-box-containing protein
MRSVPNLPPENVEAVVHELRVHQIELEMQCQELQRAQHEVEESRDRYRELYESIPIGYVTLEATGLIRDLNPAGMALLAEAGADRPQGTFTSYLSERDADRFILFCRGVVSRQEPNADEFRLKRLDGRSFHALLHAVPVQKGAGQGEQLRIAFKDITRRKEAEEALRRHETELEANREELRELTSKLFSAQEDERKRIALDIHDDHCQRLAALILEARSLAKLSDSMAPFMGPRLMTMASQLGGLLADFRTLSHDLHPRNLGYLSLAGTLRQLGEEFAERAGFHVECRERSTPADLPPALTTCLYRLLQETLSNIAKPAQATHVVVTMEGRDDEVRLTVTDNGKGFDVRGGKHGRKGLGLVSMQERVRPLGGTLGIDSKPEDGTTVSVSIPLPCH